jgi:HSP20 family protein
MTDETKNLDIKKEEIATAEGTERTRARRAFVPRATIYETDDEVDVVADLPGVDEKSVDLMLEKNELTINGTVNTEMPEGYTLAYAEYEVGDYQRKFIISNEIDRDNIEATVKDGVLRLKLPKAQFAKTRKVMVRPG